MTNVAVLDCTLRDGGYINDWQFGANGIRRVVRGLELAGVDIIECGFLSDAPYTPGRSVFPGMTEAIAAIAPKKAGVLYVGMIAFGELAAEKIPPRGENTLDGIRLTFHPGEWEPTRALAEELIQKGYRVFIQPVGTSGYNDCDFLKLIDDVNALAPYAFYIVDTLGCMYENELLRLFYLADHNLTDGIHLGFHAHNNLQLAFSNAQSLISAQSTRSLILDASVYGMGRAAGNLCTELLVQYLNAHAKTTYDVLPLLAIVDDILLPIYSRTSWGYSIPYSMAAVEGVHPNYAIHLMNKQTINVRSIATILKKIPRASREIYDETLIEQLYLQFQSVEVDDSLTLAALTRMVKGRTILLLAPGRSILSHAATIRQSIQANDALTIPVNFVPENYTSSLLFISNTKRFDLSEDYVGIECPIVVTSNIMSSSHDARYHVVNYASLLGGGREADNAGVMLVRLLQKLDAKKILIAGMDGFSRDQTDNYITNESISTVEKAAIQKKNEAIKAQLDLLRNQVEIEFITPSRYGNGGEG